MSLIMCNITTNDNNNNNNTNDSAEVEKNALTIYRWGGAFFIQDLMLTRERFRCPIASLDCMEEFTGRSRGDYGNIFCNPLYDFVTEFL